MIPLIIIQGPTASGKSTLAIQLAELFNTEIISADSRQIYRYMDIGTAKISKYEQQQVKHHLIDIIDPDHQYSAGQFVEDAEIVIHDLFAKNKIPIICGGTGMYIKSLLEGIFKIEEIDPKVKEGLIDLLNERGLPHLYQMLCEADYELAKKIMPQDTQRILRALEVWKGTGKSLREHWKEQTKENKYLVCNIYLDCERDLLYQRINQRMDDMLKKGLLDELITLFKLGYHDDDFGLNTVGYKEFIPYIHHESGIEECLVLAKQHSRNYAKRQYTWYKNCKFNFAISQNNINLSEIKARIEYSLA